MKNMKKLPIGIQSFEKIRSDNYYYVDKTRFIEKLVSEGGGYYFLSRPRRFGKSLFIDTLKQAFLGKKELFKGLYLENHWDWDKQYPVISISFGAGVHRNVEELLITEQEILEAHAKKYKLTLTRPSIKGKFLELIEMLCEKYNEKVVVLVDEYVKTLKLLGKFVKNSKTSILCLKMLTHILNLSSSQEFLNFPRFLCFLG